MAARFFESSSISVKAVVIGLIALVLLVPLTMLRGLVSERAAMREQAYARVAEGWGGDVVIGGPMLIVPTERVWFENDKRHVERSPVYVLPAQLDADIDVKLESEPREISQTMPMAMPTRSTAPMTTLSRTGSIRM